MNKKGILGIILTIVLLAAAVSGYMYLTRPDYYTVTLSNGSKFKFQTTGSLNDLIYSATADQAYDNGVAWFSSQALVALDGNCKPEALSSAAVSRYVNKEAAEVGLKEVRSIYAEGLRFEEEAKKKDEVFQSQVSTRAEIVGLADGSYLMVSPGSNTYCSNNQQAKELQKKLSDELMNAVIKTAELAE
jgi:hypothetical protein